MKKITLFAWLLLLLTASASAQVISFHLKNGNIDTLQMDAFDRMYFVDSTTSVVRLQTPYNGESHVALRPLFTWQYLPGRSYEMILSPDGAFGDTLCHAAFLDTNAFVPDQPLHIQTRYYWKVRVAGETLWSAALYFNTWQPSLPSRITSLVWQREKAPGVLSLKYASDSQLDSILVVYGRDGITFPDTAYCDTFASHLSGLESDTCYYLRAAGVNAAGTGPFSEVLAATPSAEDDPVLIVNAFDRASTGNTYDFIRQHAAAVTAHGKGVISASNEALTDSLITLSSGSEELIYILGEESTVDETFSAAEQEHIKTYLRRGGNLFVSGAEIAWDLDNKGSTADKAFCRDYLRMRYVQDAPNNADGTYYRVEALGDTIFSDLTSFSFDNGTHGTYNVKYPDVLGTVNDSRGFLKYTGCSTAYAGVVYQGLFPGGTQEGKVMVLGFPFETVYPQQARVEIMREFFEFSEIGLGVGDEPAIPNDHFLYQNYPNPFNPRTAIGYQLSTAGKVKLTIIDLKGREIETLVNRTQSAGSYEIIWDAGPMATGVYICVLKVDNIIKGSFKMLLVK